MKPRKRTPKSPDSTKPQPPEPEVEDEGALHQGHKKTRKTLSRKVKTQNTKEDGSKLKSLKITKVQKVPPSDSTGIREKSKIGTADEDSEHQEVVKTVKKSKSKTDDRVSTKDTKRKEVKNPSKADPKGQDLAEENEGVSVVDGSKTKPRRNAKRTKEVIKTESITPTEKKRKRLIVEEPVADGKKQKLNKEPKARAKKAARKSPKKKGIAKNSVLEEGVTVKEEATGVTPDKVVQVEMAKEIGLKVAKFVGAHMSVAGGLDNAVKGAVATGARAFALFLRSQRQWASKPLEDEPAERFRQACREHNFPPHLILPHGSYLLNCGSPNDETLRKSREALADELHRCEKLGLTRYNFHPGSSCGQIPLEECLDKIGESINIVHQQTTKVMTVIENMSCQGNTVGGRFEELRGIIDRVEDKTRIGVCLDTCHAFAAGFDLASDAGYQTMMADFDQIVGFKYLVAVHLNDSKGKVGSHLDRHEKIGRGQIGLKAFRRLMNDPRFDNIPLILETPVEDGMDYADEIKLLNSLVHQS